MKRLTITLLIGLSAALGVSACGPGDAPAMVATAEAEALAAMGIDPADIVAAELAPTAAPADKGGKNLDRWKQRRFAKVALHRNTLHGEAVVQTKEGTITVLVQRGVVTAIDADSVTVKSSDGFTLTWKFSDKMRVVEKRTTIQPGQIKVGSELALAGAKESESAVARLIVVPLPAGTKRQ